MPAMEKRGPAACLECIKVGEPFVYRQSENATPIRKLRNPDYRRQESEEFSEDSKSSKSTSTLPARSKSHRCLGTVEKRNARERTRVYVVNQAFSTLRSRIPSLKGSTKRVSKLRILKSAINYIYNLKDQLAEEDSDVSSSLCNSEPEFKTADDQPAYSMVAKPAETDAAAAPKRFPNAAPNEAVPLIITSNSTALISLQCYPIASYVVPNIIQNELFNQL
ncbi:unnamed protein product [Bursaphelenchus xylophilus]|uniref:(pine wood nematode) hypothetical protein n=1 Tax=Bursaphelenchus xylophilus TaxID=6326 RepID=A0A1I7RZL4_BURXY|nr:unnamed protein product [Bursaphelenchus xylophilus]CAG9111372.1 unnamed protein product [Bursaphelenchus xylophilus]